MMHLKMIILQMLQKMFLSLTLTSAVLSLAAKCAAMNQENLLRTVESLSRQIMMQQFYVEEKARSEGQSGIKVVRHYSNDGTCPYYGDTHTAQAAAHIHDHADFDRTAGIGEFIAVLNGVEFRTRHNDYGIAMPDLTSKDYNKLIQIPYPEVPPSVLNQQTVRKQIDEMAMYFKAFKLQDSSIREYQQYFKPILCYVEGAWTTSSNLEEPFESQRHSIDASSWSDLRQKNRFTSYTGVGRGEELPFLPTTIINVAEDGVPTFAQWNYRIVCHPIEHKLHLQDFSVIDDLSARMRMNKNLKEFAQTRLARFKLAPKKGSGFDPDDGYGHWQDDAVNYGLIDTLMAEVPGRDNYPGHHEDHALNLQLFSMASKENTTLDTGRYHRKLRIHESGRPYIKTTKRGFADGNMWVAATDQTNIAAMSVEDCEGNVCHKYTARYTYAIPLEIIWLTPLFHWNPYGLDFNVEAVVTADGRNGGFDVETAYDGTSSTKYYRVPAELFPHGEPQRGFDDSNIDAVGVLDPHKQVRNVTASGQRVFTPHIPGVGRVRLRYPIYPVHEEGSTIMKELSALKEIVMNMEKYANMFTK